MKCPFCQTTETGVLDSRATENESVIRRRRECKVCQRRFTTYERVEAEPLVVVKKDGSREIFSREKLLTGLLLAFRKSKIPAETLDEFVSSIERSLLDEGRREVTAAELGDVVLSGLKLMDPVAYVRFASVYREFDSIDSFRDVLAAFENR
jgi:transcriptional repressor NrdR